MGKRTVKKSKGKKVKAKKAGVKSRKPAAAVAAGSAAGWRKHRSETEGQRSSKPVFTMQNFAGEPTLPTPKLQGVKLADVDLSESGGRAGDVKDLAIDELAASIQETGQIDPIIVVESGAGGKGAKYRLADGYRRCLARKKLGYDTVFAEIYPAGTSVEQLRALAVFQKLDHDDISKALMVAELIDKEAGDIPWSEVVDQTLMRGAIERVAQKLGKSLRWVNDYRYVGRLSPASRELVKSGRLPLAHAREIATLADPGMQDDMAREAAREKDGSGGRSLEQITRWVREKRNSLRGVRWELNQPFAGKVACAACPNNTVNDALLYEHDPKEQKYLEKDCDKGLCTNKACFDHKRDAAERAIEKARQKVPVLVKGKQLTKATVEAVTAAKLVPAGLKPKVILDVARGEIEWAANKAKGKDASKDQAAEPVKAKKIERKPEDIAQERLDAAMGHYAETLRTNLKEALLRRPGGISMLTLVFGESTELAKKLTPSYRGDDVEKKMAKIVQSPATIELAKSLFGVLSIADETTPPALKALHAAEMAAMMHENRSYSNAEAYVDDSLHELADVSVAFLLEIIGEKPPEKPLLETFLKEVGAEAKAGESEAHKA